MKAMQSENRLTTFLTFAMTLCLAAVATTMLLYQGSPVGGHGGMVNGPHLQAASGHDADANSRQRMLSAYSRLPLAFEENQGQTDAQVKYLARGGGYTLFLTPNEAVLSLAAGNKGGAAAVVRMQMVGAQAQPKVSAEQRLAGVSNYFIGRDPHGWHRDVPHYGRVHVGEVYPGIDVAYHGGERQLEFDFLVAPGADPAEIALKFSGANQLQTDRDGNLALTAGSHEVVLHKPVAYQQADGMRQAVEARFVIENDKVAFALGSYDQRRELVIDPTVSYSTYLGGSGEDDANGIAVDATG